MGGRVSRRRFSDAAGYTRHCWECAHAKGWERTGEIDGDRATCELTSRFVHRYDSPNNLCCHMPGACEYEGGTS